MRPFEERVQTKHQVIVRQFDPFAVENKNEGVSCCKPPRFLLRTDDNTSKLKYKTSKARALTRNVDVLVAPVPTTSSIAMNASSDQNAHNPPTVESGLKELGLIRPLDNKTYEFGLAKGIQMHLVESIKLCGLKKGREKCLLDMVSTLCNYLANREVEIERWIEFADKIALTSAKKLNNLTEKHVATTCYLKDDALNAAMVSWSKEVRHVRKEIFTMKDEVTDTLKAFSSTVCDVEKLRHKVKCFCLELRSTCQSEARCALDELASSHNDEKWRLDLIIDRQEKSMKVEDEKLKSLQRKLDESTALIKKRETEHLIELAAIKKDKAQLREDMYTANERIKSLELLVENEKVLKEKELRKKDEEMMAELDVIDKKVRLSIKSLIEGHNEAMNNVREVKNKCIQ